MTQVYIPPRRWSDTEHQKFLALTQAKVSADEIARQLGRSASSIYSRTWLFDLSLNKATNEEKRAAWLEEMTWARLVSCHGEKRATAIVSGLDPQTQADIARWNTLGRRSAA